MGTIRSTRPSSNFRPREGQTDCVDPMTKRSLEALIASAPAVVFGRDTCPYCVMASRTLVQKLGKNNVKFVEVAALTKADLALLAQDSKLSTVPKVYVNGRCVGGATDLTQLISMLCRHQ
jgi:glutaredoxin